MEIINIPEVLIKKYEVLEIQEKLEQNSGPAYTVIDLDTKVPLHQIIANFKEAFLKSGKSSFLPYPFYIICPHSNFSEGLNIVKSIDDIPPYFQDWNNEWSPTDGLSRQHFFSRRIASMDVDEKMNVIKERTKNTKILYRLNSECRVYSKILKHLGKPID